MELYIKAIGLGFVLIFMIGPVFFSLIQTSIERGFFAGMIMAIGISLSDITFVIVSYLGLSTYLRQFSEYMGPVGGTIFLFFGFFTLLKNKGKIEYKGKIEESNNLWKYLLKGFLINAASPFIIIFWIATVGTISSKYLTHTENIEFFGLVLIVVLAGDIIKAALSHKLKNLMNARLLRIMNWVVGIGLILMGLRLFFVHLQF